MKLTIDKMLKKPLLHNHEEVTQNTEDINQLALHATFDYYVKSGDWDDLYYALTCGEYGSIYVPAGDYICTQNVDDYAITVDGSVYSIYFESGEKPSGLLIRIIGSIYILFNFAFYTAFKSCQYGLSYDIMSSGDMLFPPM